MRSATVVGAGALFLGSERSWLADTAATLQAERINAEWIEPADLARRYPQLHASGPALLEPDAGVLFARRAVQALIRALTSSGVRWEFRPVDPVVEIRRSRSAALIFACGPWLPKLFPDAAPWPAG